MDYFLFPENAAPLHYSMKKVFFILLCLFVCLQLNAQTRDSSALQRTASDSIVTHDSVRQNKNLAVEAVRNTNYSHSPLEIFFPKWFSNTNANNNILLHPQSDSGDLVFFALIGMALFLGITKIIFPQYLSQLFQFMVRPRGYKKSGVNNSSAAKIISSLLLNILFIITVSWCLVWVSIKEFSPEKYGLYWAYAAIALAVIYLIKHSIVAISGWIFDAKRATSIYNYVVFSINKIVGVLLVPIIILITYCFPQVPSVIRSTLIIFAFLLLVYRYIASLILIRENSKVNIFHFFLYLCGVEIMPLLLVYKLLLMNWSKII